jgi:hypothetical protein
VYVDRNNLKRSEIHPAYVLVKDADGEVIGNAFAADTEEGWLDCHAIELRDGVPRVVVDSRKGETVNYRVHRYYQLFHRKTGELLATSSSPVIHTWKP